MCCFIGHVHSTTLQDAVKLHLFFLLPFRDENSDYLQQSCLYLQWPNLTKLSVITLLGNDLWLTYFVVMEVAYVQPLYVRSSIYDCITAHVFKSLYLDIKR